MASTPLLPSTSRKLDNGPCHAPGLCILGTIPLRTPLAEVSYPISNSTFPDTNFAVTHGFVGLPDQDLVSESCEISLQSPKLQPR